MKRFRFKNNVYKLIVFLTVFFIFSENVYALDTSAECACLIAADSGEILYEKNPDVRHQMASTTKIMTAVIALERNSMNDTVVVSANAASQEGSSIYLRGGEEISVKNLVYGMMLNSGNDAACAIAEHICGSVEEFAEIMTKKAHEIGAVNTSFKNASGLDADGHYSTAADMAKIAAYAMRKPEFREIVSTKTAQIETSSGITYLKNHNKLLWNYDGCIGVKTGYTKSTGRCLVSCAERDGVTLIAVTLGAPDDWKDHSAMLDYGFESTECISLAKKGDILKSYNNKKYSFNGVCEKDITASAKKNAKQKTDIVVHALKAPTNNISVNEKIGYAQFYLNGNYIGQCDLLCDRDVILKKNNDNNGFFDNIYKIIKKILIKL
ncbi:MAG: D-alanyl-D-alanine carboxypeptidase family protein [Clostridia bacterium]|nr:D-alanyl-D-alanine carboxypeptidase family protein [Clostridia bacterium]